MRAERSSRVYKRRGACALWPLGLLKAETIGGAGIGWVSGGAVARRRGRDGGGTLFGCGEDVQRVRSDRSGRFFSLR